MAIDKREYLVARGLAKPGRGKFSNAAKDALKAAEAEGVVFIDRTREQASVAVKADDGTVTVERRDIDPFSHHPDPIREGLLSFGKGKDAIKVSAKEACHKCRYSFGWCYCPAPAFLNYETHKVVTLNV